MYFVSGTSLYKNMSCFLLCRRLPNPSTNLVTRQKELTPFVSPDSLESSVIWKLLFSESTHGDVFGAKWIWSNYRNVCITDPKWQERVYIEITRFVSFRCFWIWQIFIKISDQTITLQCNCNVNHFRIISRDR